ncbi:MAG: response regulator [Melioribacteraceae bacterium]|nr:response regulator [Melioribacteraceae bacterium]
MENFKLPVLLIVEDDKENLKYLKLLLRNIFIIEDCDNAEDFHSLINSKTIDIILMDITIHGSKDGLQLTKEIKSNPKFVNIPIVVLTAHAFQKDKLNATEVGVDKFLTKPVDGIILRNTLLELVKKNI